MAQQVESSGRPVSGMGGIPLALGGMLGIGVFVGPAPAAAAAGPWLPVGLLVALLAAACAASATAHQSVTYRGPGAVYACVRARMGVLPARIGASAQLAGQIAVLAAIARVLGEFFLPSAAPQVAAVALLLVVLAATAGLRIRGVAAWIWLALTLAVLGVVVVTCFAIEPATVSSTGRPLIDSAGADSAAGITGAAGVLFIAFLGFERLTMPDTEQDRFAWSAMKRGTTFSLVALAVVLAVVTAALVYQLGWSRLALSPAPIRDVLTAAAAADLAPLVGVGAAVALLPVLLGALESFRSTALALVHDRDLPRVLGRTGGAGTPYLLDLAAGGAAVVVALLVEPVAAMALAACCLLVHYAFANAGARLLLTEGRTWPMRAACLGMGVSVVLAMSMPISAMLATLVVVVVGPLVTGGVSRHWS